MRLVEIGRNVWINVGTGAVTRVDMETVRGIYAPTVFLSDGHKIGFTGQSLAELVKALKSHEQEDKVNEV